jgi:hypothetical protein
MLKRKLTSKRPLFCLLLPIFIVMAFLGFPMPVPPPPETKPGQVQSMPGKKRRPVELEDK